MREITEKFTVYKFDELPEEGKQKALENLYDLNVDYDWWDFTYMDAENIGLKITAFDLGRAQSIEGEFLLDPVEVAEKIIEAHGESCGTYETATNYLEERKQLHVEQAQAEADTFSIPGEWVEEYFDDYRDFRFYPHEEIDFTDVDDEFLHALLQDYLSMLDKEYDYLTSEEAIIETIEANDYEFTIDGEIY